MQVDGTPHRNILERDGVWKFKAAVIERQADSYKSRE